MKKFEATFIDPLDKDPVKIICVGDVYSQALMQAERFLEIEQNMNPKKVILISMLVIDSDYNPVCPKCGKPLIPSEVGNYELQCLDCDEDFYLCEVRD